MMRKAHAVFIVWFLLLGVLTAQAQQDASNSTDGARAVLVQFLALNKSQSLRSEQARKLLIGESTQWDIPAFGNLADAPDKVVLTEKGNAVGRVQGFGQNDRVADLYFYLKYDGGWKISAMRSLAMTGMLEKIYLSLKDRKSLTPEEKETLANIKLVLSSDEALQEWFAHHQASLNQLAQLVRSRVKLERGVSEGYKSQYIRNDDKQHTEISSALRELHLSGIDITPDTNFEFIIGGMLDNTVGFLYSPTKTPPRIAPDQHIWVEEVAEHWYLFRTT